MQLMKNVVIFNLLAGQKPIISSSDEIESSLTGFTKLTSTIGSSISILAGSGIRILCPVRGIPRPVVTWNIKRKSNSNRMFLDKTQNFVTIPKLVSGDFGEFTCIAKNILGEARASSALNVIGESMDILFWIDVISRLPPPASRLPDRSLP